MENYQQSPNVMMKKQDEKKLKDKLSAKSL